MKYDILTIGDSDIDQFFKVKDASVQCDINHEDCKISFKYAEKIPVEDFQMFPGGNAINVAMGCASFGLNSSVYTEVGDDFGADLIIKQLKSKNTSVEFVVKDPNSVTSVHPIVVFEGERTIFSYHVNRSYKIKKWETPKFIYYTSIGAAYPDFQPKILKYLNEHPEIILAFNPGSHQIKLGTQTLSEILKRVDVAFLNKQEAEIITGIKSNLEEIHTKLIETGVKLSVITDSSNGSSVFDGKNLWKLGICELGPTIDKTGAGDSYASGFLSAMFYGKSAEEAMKWGTVNSASVITQAGATNGLMTKEKIEKLLLNITFSKPNL